MDQLIALSRGEGLTPRYYSALLFQALETTGSVISEGDNFDVAIGRMGGGLPHCEEGYVFGPLTMLPSRPRSHSRRAATHFVPRTAGKNFRRAFRTYRSTTPMTSSADRDVFLSGSCTDGR